MTTVWIGRSKIWFDFCLGQEILIFSLAFKPALESTRCPVEWVPRAPKVKRPRREFNHSPPWSARVAKAWSYTPTLPYVFIVRCLIRIGHNIIIILLLLCHLWKLSEDETASHAPYDREALGCFRYHHKGHYSIEPQGRLTSQGTE